MARSDQQSQETRISVWDFEGDGHANGHTSRAAPTLWQRLRAAVAMLRWSGRAHDERSSAELSTLPTGSRGQALREAHRLLRRQLRRNAALRAVMPELRQIEQALAELGSSALLMLSIPVLRRGLMQLGHLPWDDSDELGSYALHTLRLRLVEAIERRGLGDSLAGPDQGAADSFHGSEEDSRLSSLGPTSLPPAGVVVDSLDDTAIDQPPAPLRPGSRREPGLGSPRR